MKSYRNFACRVGATKGYLAVVLGYHQPCRRQVCRSWTPCNPATANLIGAGYVSRPALTMRPAMRTAQQQTSGRIVGRLGLTAADFAGAL